MAVEPQNRPVIFGSQLRAPHVFHANERPVAPRLQNDVVEFRRLAEPSYGPHADLKRVLLQCRRLADLSGGYLHVLFLQRAQDVRGRQAVLGHFRGIQPQAHSVLAFPEDNRVAHPFHALQRVLHVNIEIVAEEQAAVLALVGIHAGAEHESANLLRDDDARIFHFVRKPAERLIYAILYVHRGQVHTARYVKDHCDLARAVVAAR